LTSAGRFWFTAIIRRVGIVPIFRIRATTSGLLRRNTADHHSSKESGIRFSPELKGSIIGREPCSLMAKARSRKPFDVKVFLNTVGREERVELSKE
jgi:hypothetical protein